MKRKRFLLVPLIVMGFSIGVVMFSYLHQDNTVTSQVEGKQERTGRATLTAMEKSESHNKDLVEPTSVETPEQVEREISGIVELPQVLHAPETVEEDEENPPAPEEPADPVAAAWAHLEYIAQNLQQWGAPSSEATELIEQLTPTWRTKAKGETEEAIVLLEELAKLQDPRSAEILVNYLNESGLWVRYVETALIAIGPPSVPLLVPILDDHNNFLNSFKRRRAAKLLSIIGSEHRRELGGAVEYIILPKLEELATLDPDYSVREIASEAISRLSSREQGSTIAPQIEGKQEQTDRVAATAAEMSEQSQIPHAPEPIETDEANPSAPEESADPVAAVWAHLEYISQNPQQWGELSPEAMELIDQLTPTWVMRSEGEGEQAIELLAQLTKLRDPRSAEIFVNYFRAGVSGRPMKVALIEIGPPSVLPLISLLDVNTGFLKRRIGAELLGIIGSEYLQELDGAVEYIILPKLKELATSDRNSKVREVAGEAISRFGYLHQDNTVETPEQVEREINGAIEQPQALQAPEQIAKDEEHPPAPVAPADPVAAAWAHLEYISQNPQRWGELSPEATVLMEQLTPTRTISTEEETEEVIVLLEELAKLQDPRSAEIIVNYFLKGGLWGKPMKEALIGIGLPSVPQLIPFLNSDTRLLGRLIASKLLGIIGSEYQQELGGAVEYIILPKLKKLVTLDPNPRVRWYASIAISRLSYRHSDNTVTPKPDKPADPVAAAWARLEYISQNPQEWGEFSPEAAELMTQLTPTWVFNEADGEGPAEAAMQLLKKLASFQDPRSPEIFVNYYHEGIGGGALDEAVIAIGPPSVLPLISLLDANTRFLGRLIGVDLLGLLGEKHRHELGGAVEHIILPKLEIMARSDPSPGIRESAREAIARLR